MGTIRLNQVIALSKDAASAGEGALTKAYRNLEKAGPMSGISRVYAPKDDEGEKLPSESTRLQLRVEEILGDARKALTRQLDLSATLDVGNQSARADVIVDGNIILTDVPVTTLLTLEKKLGVLATFVAKLPTLAPEEEWTFDSALGAFKTQATQTVRTKKIPRNHVKAEATDKHAAQVDVYYEDQVVGYWSTTKTSGAIPEVRRRELVEKVAQLQAAVKKAREEANSSHVDDVHYGQEIFDFLGW